jgi:thiol:disulfide interchange protein/DsbC/DsbD-like thiol-disulfide interchange protein
MNIRFVPSYGAAQPALSMPNLKPLFAAFLALALPLAAQFEMSFGTSSGDPRSERTLVSQVSAIAPGEAFTVALQLTHPEGWHSYYQNSGGPEESLTISWTLPKGFTAGPIQWPVPEVKDGYFGKSFIYNGAPIFLVEITPPHALEVGETVTLVADAKWQICEISCIEESEKFTLELPVSTAGVVDPEQSPLFEQARRKLPVTTLAWQMRSESEGQDIRLYLTPDSDSKASLENLQLEFIPDQDFIKSFGDGGSVSRTDDGWVIALQRNRVDPISKEPRPQGNLISGILSANGALDPGVGATAILIPELPIASPPAQPLPLSSLLPLLGLMMLGGLILNLMPCVFPVIGLKIMGFVQQAGSDRKKIIAHGVIFTLGVLASFAVLSGVLFAAREAALAKGGTDTAALGWGYQLQNPWVVLALMLLMFVLALNMFGLFEIGTAATSVGGGMQSRHGVAGTFFSGILATVVATPCSAPFLGVAVGTAITLPAAQFFAAFAAMAIGLALPYLVLSAFPALLAYLPRPGAWMESFKQAMSFLLFATAGYLLWVYGQQIGLDNLLGPLFGLSMIGAAAWIYGRWHLPHRSRQARAIAIVLSLMFAIAGFVLAKPPKPSEIVWEPWSQERETALLDEGIPVFVDFTASWCVTCQTNKATGYGSEVARLIKEKGIVMLKADKSSPSPEIDAKLASYKRTMIPVNVLLVPGKEPFITEVVLAPGYLADLFAREIPDEDETGETTP